MLRGLAFAAWSLLLCFTATSVRIEGNGTDLSTEIPESSSDSLLKEQYGQPNGKEEIFSQIPHFRQEFMAYEKRILTYMDSLRKGQLTLTLDSAQFLGELKKYMAQLPKNTTKFVTQKYRSKCYCEGGTKTPCPERCVYSCHAYHQGNWVNEDDCTIIDYSDCYCYDGSSIECDNGNIEACYRSKRVEVAEEVPCSQFSVNSTNVEMSFIRFSGLLIEPIKILIREAEFRFSHTKQAVIATELLSNITASSCQGQVDPMCIPEATTLLIEKLNYYRQFKKNMTLELIKSQDEMEAIAKSVHVLKEQTFAQINKSIKDYTCCLIGLNFSVSDHDCNPTTPTEISTSSSTTVKTIVRHKRCPPSEFLCSNLRCVPDSYECDGGDDCGDNSDEVGCDTP